MAEASPAAISLLRISARAGPGNVAGSGKPPENEMRSVAVESARIDPSPSPTSPLVRVAKRCSQSPLRCLVCGIGHSSGLRLHLGAETIDEQDVNCLWRHLPEADEGFHPIDTGDGPDLFEEHISEVSGVS
jgi:hypothetical protein